MIRDDSPCAPIHNPDCGLIGAWPVGCLSVAVPDLALEGPILHLEPNPFRDAIRIDYEIPPRDATEPVQLAIFDLEGRLVRLLLSAGTGMGPHRVVWDGRNERGEPVMSGVYFCRLSNGSVVETRRLILVE